MIEQQESVGPHFSEEKLAVARNKTLEVIEKVASKVKAGTTEAEAKAWLLAIQSSLGAPKSWHPPQIRFGENTLLAFGQRGKENVRLNKNDLFFLDIGPIFDGFEGDVGRTFYLGDDPEMKRCCEDVERIWRIVRDHWSEHSVSGEQLYRIAQSTAHDFGWVLSLDKANGHRIADFPHAAKMRGSIEGFLAKPANNRWILEIQIRHPIKPFGAFYEDLLN